MATYDIGFFKRACIGNRYNRKAIHPSLSHPSDLSSISQMEINMLFQEDECNLPCNQLKEYSIKELATIIFYRRDRSSIRMYDLNGGKIIITKTLRL
jgi:hypothetical protein